MCGIAGILRLHDPKEGTPPPHLEAIPERWLDILDESIRHRGPDGAGRFRDRAVRADGTVVDVALVHRRLAIIDIAGGQQPMVHDGERLRPDLTYAPGEAPVVASERAPGLPLVAVVFNGCVYNHRELRAELEGKEYRFGTDHSDTEVLVHGWREWGLELIDRLDGMFTWGSWDRHNARLHGARDAFGEKPLYTCGIEYGHNHGEKAWGAPFLAFSSTYSSLVRLTQTTNRIATVSDYEIGAWIQFGWNRGAELVSCLGSTIAGTVEEIAPAHERAPSGHGLLWQHAVLNPTEEPVTSAQIDGLLRTAVGSRLEADVPLGCFLSGGIDSSLIARYASEERPDLEAFTVRMPEAQFDEAPVAAAVARHLGVRHRILECEADPANDLLTLIPQLGLPFGDSSLLPTYWVSRAARGHVRVALAGDGGDELFLGYDRHRTFRLLPKIGILTQGQREAIAAVRLQGRSQRSKLERAGRLLAVLAHNGYKELLAIFPTPLIEQLGVDPGSFRHWGLTTTWDAELAEPTARRFDLLFYLTEDLLRKTDTASMAVGLEVRAPFLAREVAEPVINAPMSCLMPNNQRKGLLKQVARKYLPPEIFDRPKQGFAIPIGEWFRTDYGSMRQLLYDHLESADPFPGLADAGVNINMDFVRRMLREHDAAGDKSLNPWHGRDHSQRLYMLLVLSIWAKWLQGVRRGASSAGG